MSSMTHSLGSFKHIYAKRHLNLNTQASITLFSLDALQFPFSTVFQDIETLVSSETWITAGNSFTLAFLISFDGVSVEGGDTADHVEELGQVLCNAEIWSQLCLTPSLSIAVSLDTTFETPKKLMLTLKPRHNVSVHETRVSGSSALGPAGHVRPPTGVPSAHIERIELCLRFARYPPVESNTLKRKRDGDTKNEIRSGFPACSQTSNATHQTYVPSPISQTSPSEQKSEIETQMTEMLEEDIEDTFITSAPVSSKFRIPDDSQTSISSQISLSALTRRIDLTSPAVVCNQPPLQSIKFAELTKLVDCSLRGMIFGPRPTSSAYLLSSTSNDPRLGQICPAVFSPGYMQAVSNRRYLVSTIAGTISRIYRRTTRVSLQQMMRRLPGIPMEKYSPITNADLSDTDAYGQSLWSAAEARLWLLLQRALQDSNACSRLKALSAEGENLRSEAESKQMLDRRASRPEKRGEKPNGLDLETDVLIYDPEISQLESRKYANDLVSDEEDVYDILDGNFETHCPNSDGLDEDLFLYDFSTEEDNVFCEAQHDEDLFWSEGDDGENLLDETCTSSWAVSSIVCVETDEDELLEDSKDVASHLRRASATGESLLNDTSEQPANRVGQTSVDRDSEMLLPLGSD